MKRDATQRITQNSSSLLQGVLMEYVQREYGEILHQSNLKPYSQYVEVFQTEFRWTIRTLTEEAKKQIIAPIYESCHTSIFLKHNQMELEILNKQMESYEYSKLVEDYFLGNHSRYVTIEFISPTAFKSNKEYVFYPSVRLIFQSLIMKFDEFSENQLFEAEELLKDIEKYVRISDYHIQSKKFHLEGIRIPAFLGKITFQIKGSSSFMNMVHLLSAFGEYSGVGIKSAIGMGGIRMLDKRG